MLNECGGDPSLPKTTDDMSKMASFAWLHVEPTLYRAATVFGESVGDAIFDISSEAIGRSRNGTGELENVKIDESISLGCESIPIIGAEKSKSVK